jgi:shikimate 5-dehydrogenase
MAREQGKRAIGGGTMFLAQAQRQFEIWTGESPPDEVFSELPA